MTQSSYIDKKGKAHLWGLTDIQSLKEGEYKEWFDKNYEEFETKLSTKDKDQFEDVEVKVFIGTWCGDTKYLLPRFIKAWDNMGLNQNQLEIVALHNEDELYKLGPDGETAGLNIHRVPTFIFERDGSEIGRIVERTVFDLATDMKSIVADGRYKQRYHAVTLMDAYLKEADLDSLGTYTALKEGYNKVYREVSTYGELNTYGYVLLSHKRIDEAEFIFKLNRYLFSYHPNARDSYGEVLMKNEKWEESKKEYLESIRLNPENDNAMKQLVILNEKLKAQKESNDEKAND